MQKFQFAQFSVITGFCGFPENYKEISVSEGAMQIFRKLRIFLHFPSPIGWKITECIRVQTDGRTFGKLLFLISAEKWGSNIMCKIKHIKCVK